MVAAPTPAAPQGSFPLVLQVFFEQGDSRRRWEGAVPGGTPKSLPSCWQMLAISLLSCCGFFQLAF